MSQLISTADGSAHGPGLRVENVSKTFAGTKALDGVSAHFPAGKITALLGENGSGKSTLIKILAGFYEPDDGSRLMAAGKDLPVPISPKQAHDAGLRFIHQDLGLVTDLTVADNFAFVGGFGTSVIGKINRRKHEQRVQAALDAFDVHVAARELVSALTPTQRTMVAIARAFASEDDGTNVVERAIVLDEPTAALPAEEVYLVFDALKKARAAGATVIFVSHRIEEVRELADRLVVLRDGRVTADQDLADLSIREIVNLILGREFTRVENAHRAIEDRPVLECHGMSGNRLHNLDLTLHAGEIVGVTGLLGCGRSELTRLITGAQPVRAGSVKLEGTPLTLSGPRSAIAAGVASVPQERRTLGCIGDMTLRENITLSDLRPFLTRGRLRKSRERAVARDIIREFEIRPGDPERPMSQFSGGNQQKAVVAKWTRIKPKVLVLDEPTQGVDIGAKQEIARIITAAADGGMAILVASSDLEELVHLCDRVLVLNRGRLVAEVPREALSEEHLTVLSTTLEGAAS